MEKEQLIEKLIESYFGYNKKMQENVLSLYEQLDCNEIVSGNPVIYLATKKAEYQAVELLINKGADTSIKDDNDSNLLHTLAYAQARDYAVNADEEKTATLLIKAGVSVLQKNVDNVTAVHVAVKNNKAGLIKAVASQNKKMDFTTRDGDTALHLAIVQANSIADYYYKYSKPDYDKAIEKYGNGTDVISTTKMKSAKESFEKKAKELEDIFCIIQVLVDKGLDPDQKNNYGKTPKMLAMDCKDVRVSAVLAGDYIAGEELDESKKLSLATKGMNLMQAVEKRDYDAVDALLKQGADPNELYGDNLSHRGTDLIGKTPLAMACIYLDEKLVKLLLDNKADPNLLDSEENHPLFYSFISGGYVNTNTFKNKTIDNILNMFLEKGFNVNTPVTKNNMTLVCYASKVGPLQTSYNSDCLSKKVLEWLLRKNANVNIADNDGVTPLMYVCNSDKEFYENIQISMLENDANINARDKNGKTPLMYCAKNYSKSLSLSMAKMLFEFGTVDVNAVNNDEKTALALTAETNNENLLNYLLEKGAN